MGGISKARPGGAIGATAGNQRIEDLDILRGFALFGVVVINMSVDTIWSQSYVVQTPGSADDIIAGLLRLFGAGKFLTIFSFLFGLGVFMQMRRCEARGVAFAPLLVRRMSVLLLIGLMHYLFVGWTDILHVYAVLGMLLLLFHRCSARVLLVTAVALMLLNVGDPKPLLVMAGEKVFAMPATDPAGRWSERQGVGAGPVIAIGERYDIRELTVVYTAGSYREILQANLQDFRTYIRNFAPRWWIGSVFPVMLLGAYAARRRIVENAEEHSLFLRRVFWWATALGLGGSVLTLLGETLWEAQAWSFQARQLKNAADVLGIRALGFAYASGLLLLLRTQRWKKRLAGLGPVGRTAFTNYLLQTVLAVALFYGFGLGLYGRLNPVLGALIASAAFLMQMLASRAWLSTFSFGPVEWLWRSLTYGRMPAMRRQKCP